MLGGFFCNMFFFFCQDANWHKPAEKILACISTIFHCTLPNNLPVQCAAVKVKHYPFSLHLQVDARQKQEGTALHGCLHSCLDATRKLGIQVLGELIHPSPRMLYTCYSLMALKRGTLYVLGRYSWGAHRLLLELPALFFLLLSLGYTSFYF